MRNYRRQADVIQGVPKQHVKMGLSGPVEHGSYLEPCLNEEADAELSRCEL